MRTRKKVIAMLNCHDDDVYCFRKEIIDDLADSGYVVLISCPYGERIEKVKRDNVIYENIEIDRRGTNPMHDYKLYRDYLRLFKKYNPIIVLAFTIKPNIYGGMAAGKLGIPYVNNITGLGSGFENGGPVKQIILLLYRIVLNKAHYILFQNETNKEKITKTGILHHQRYEVIPGSGVNLERFNYCKYPPEGKIVFNYIGRIMKDKNIDDYLFVAKELQKEHSNLEFNVIGFIEESEGHYKKELDLLEKNGVIMYRGSQQDIRPFIRRSYAIIHPSTYGEGLSNVLLESAATGRALLTTTVPGCNETVIEGINGFHFEPGNRKDMIKKIEQFINLSYDDKVRMGKESRIIAEKRFSREIVVDKYRQIVDGIAMREGQIT